MWKVLGASVFVVGLLVGPTVLNVLARGNLSLSSITEAGQAMDPDG